MGILQLLIFYIIYVTDGTFDPNSLNKDFGSGGFSGSGYESNAYVNVVSKCICQCCHLVCADYILAS
jgi:hypothetical protein